VTRCKRLRFTRGLAVAGRQLSPRPSDASPTARRAAAHRGPGDRPPAVPAVSRCRACQHHGQAVNVAPSAPTSVRMSPRAGRNAAHCPGWPLQPQRCFASRCAGRAFGAPLTLETSASPAGLTARARPEARPKKRAANLRSGGCGGDCFVATLDESQSRADEIAGRAGSEDVSARGRFVLGSCEPMDSLSYFLQAFYPTPGPSFHVLDMVFIFPLDPTYCSEDV
jgi:hypothetical protein